MSSCKSTFVQTGVHKKGKRNHKLFTNNQWVHTLTNMRQRGFSCVKKSHLNLGLLVKILEVCLRARIGRMRGRTTSGFRQKWRYVGRYASKETWWSTHWKKSWSFQELQASVCAVKNIHKTIKPNWSHVVNPQQSELDNSITAELLWTCQIQSPSTKLWNVHTQTVVLCRFQFLLECATTHGLAGADEQKVAGDFSTPYVRVKKTIHGSYACSLLIWSQGAFGSVAHNLFTTHLNWSQKIWSMFHIKNPTA